MKVRVSTSTSESVSESKSEHRNRANRWAMQGIRPEVGESQF